MAHSPLLGPNYQPVLVLQQPCQQEGFYNHTLVCISQQPPFLLSTAQYLLIWSNSLQQKQVPRGTVYLLVNLPLFRGFPIPLPKVCTGSLWFRQNFSCSIPYSSTFYYSITVPQLHWLPPVCNIRSLFFRCPVWYCLCINGTASLSFSCHLISSLAAFFSSASFFGAGLALAFEVAASLSEFVILPPSNQFHQFPASLTLQTTVETSWIQTLQFRSRKFSPGIPCLLLLTAHQLEPFLQLLWNCLI